MISSYYAFLKKYLSQVGFGWMLTFFSSFGQTFLISLYVPYLLLELGISKSAFGAYYAIATLIASFLLLQIGHYIDEKPLRPFSNKVLILLMVSCLTLAMVIHPVILLIALTGLRFAGQGLMSHISLTVMSRYFYADRGKALSISTIGYSVGEIFFPFFIGLVILWFGWRIGAVVQALMLLPLILPIPKWKIEVMDPDPLSLKPESSSKKGKFFFNMMKESRFWILTLPTFSLSFIVTGFFFYQFILAEEKGWPVEIYTLLFAGYGAVRLVFSLYGGLLTDRYSARKLFPFQLVPILFGVLSLAFVNGLEGAALFLILTGVSTGFSGVLTSATIAELYGVDNIGQVRSLFSVVMVLSSAMAPLFFGIALDAAYTFGHLAIFSAILLLIVSLPSIGILKHAEIRSVF